MSLAHLRWLVLLLLAGPVAAHARDSLAELKREVVAGVDARAKLAQEVNDSLFSFGELGFQETESTKYLVALLERGGFVVERGVSGLPTGWVARWSNGEGGPVIGLGADLDAIPKASQRPGIPWHEPLVEGAPGHGEGHNSGPAVDVVAALALKDVMQRQAIKGTILLWPGVAEEVVGGKAYMVRDGFFKGVDFVIFCHVDDRFDISWGQVTGTGMVSAKYSFHGTTAHAAGSPWQGRSALDAAMLMGVAWDMRREHLRTEQRSHYVIPDGGDQPNVVPSLASIWFYIREQDFDRIAANLEVANSIAQGAAQMTGTTVTRRILGMAAPRHFNRPMAEAAYANTVRVGMPRWSSDDQAFARAVQREAEADTNDGLPTAVQPMTPPPPKPESGGSDDIGDVSWTVPTISVRYPANIPGLPGHSWADGAAMATPIAHKGVLAGAKVVAMTALDLLLRPDLREAARTYFTQVQTKHQKYVSFLTPGEGPPTDTNEEVMARYRARMARYYYDPQRFPTYLDQLGIKYPTLQRPAAGEAAPRK